MPKFATDEIPASERLVLLDKLGDVCGKPLNQWGMLSRGIRTGFNRAFIIDAHTKDTLLSKQPNSIGVLKPLLKSDKLYTFVHSPHDHWMICPTQIFDPSKKYLVDDYPVLKGHLDLFFQNLYPRHVEHIADQCIELHDLIEYLHKPKLVWPYRGQIIPKVAYDTQGYYLDHSCCFLTSPHNLYLLGFLNSHIFRLIPYLFSLHNQGGLPCSTWIENFEIPIATKKQEEKIVELVKEILQKKSVQQPIFNLEKDLNRLIYALYDLTENEISYVERFLHSKRNPPMVDQLELNTLVKIRKSGRCLYDWSVRIQKVVYNTSSPKTHHCILNSKQKNSLTKNNPQNQLFLKKVLHGRYCQIEPYYFKWVGDWIILPSKELCRSTEISQYIKKIAQEGMNYYSLINISINEFNQPKIFWQPSHYHREQNFVYDDQNYFLLGNFYVLTGDHLLFILGVLNSPVCSWYLKNLSTQYILESQQGTLVEMLPIPKPTQEHEYAISTMVKEIIKNKPLNNETFDLEEQVNQLIYQLYELNAEEIALLEESLC